MSVQLFLKNVDKNDVGEWRIELEKVDLEKIERKVLFEESIILIPSDTSHDLITAYGCANLANSTTQIGYRMKNRSDEF